MTDCANKFKRSARSLICTPYHHLLNSIDPPVIVLLYHRVTTLTSDPEMLAVSPDNFCGKVPRWSASTLSPLIMRES